MMKKFIESYKESLAMLSTSQYGVGNYRSKRVQTSFVESKPAAQTKVYRPNKQYVTN
ncbi:hypothetical protein [Mesobacillus maritimus]|uniref:Uncharacterized protein n=1 Tax=Mesobacillus maritimus TaxID=1643336 RepID=A0ABS7KCA0_9BACI|nr:hypothetical protein [Mesobacillus maritimus]MBY0099725.1 hypothetical protein [Mesobacillus maritimus]